MADISTVVSFSLRPDDKEGRKNVQALKEYCELNHKVFSSLVIEAIKDLNEKLSIHDSIEGR